MRLNFSFSVGDDKPAEAASTPAADAPAASADHSDEGWKAVLKAWDEANEPGLDPEEQAKRMQWIGGAVKLYAIMTGREPVDVSTSLPTPASASTDRYSVVPGRISRVETKRPPKHPGAQRPVDPPVFEPYGDDEYESAIVVEETPSD